MAVARWIDDYSRDESDTAPSYGAVDLAAVKYIHTYIDSCEYLMASLPRHLQRSETGEC